MNPHILVFLFLLGLFFCNGARILAIFPYEIKSHRGVLEPIAEELAKNGHHVDVISHFSVNANLSGYKNIIMLSSLKKLPSVKFSYTYRPVDDYLWLKEINKKTCDFLGYPAISELIKNPPTDPPYDLLIVHILSGCQCFSAIGVAWNIPIVGIITTMPYPQMLHYINVPLNLAITPRHYYSYKENLNFWDRLYNMVMTNFYLHFYYKHSGYQDYYIKKYIGSNMPSYLEIEKSYSLVFSNSHYLYHGVQAQPPALIEIGGIHIKNDSSQFDPELKKVLDESENGFIYFSFGSVFAVESLEPAILERFYNVFRKIAPVRVILKSTNPKALPKNLPSNVFTYPWSPQQKLLQHPKIKSFVTHGGALGTQEAIYYKVPMICVPFFAEQRINCDISSLKNISLKLNIQFADQKDYDYVFTEILENSFYKESIKNFSAMYFNRPLSPKGSVIFWINFILHHGKNFLRTKGLDLKWWQLELLDVYAFLIACSLITLFITIFIVLCVLKYFFKKLRLLKNKKLSKKLK